MTGIVGIWLIIAAFIPNLVVGLGNEWNEIIRGILLMIGGFGALEVQHNFMSKRILTNFRECLFLKLLLS